MAARDSQTLDCIRAIQHYVSKILTPKKGKEMAITGMKCLLLDRETKMIVSMVYSMNEILAKEVFLVETIDKKPENMQHVKAVCILRPIKDNIKQLAEHLQNPRFQEYHVFFTNVVANEMLRNLADRDHHNVVKQLQEYYADYYPINSDLFTVSLNGSLALSRPRETYTPAEDVALRRAQQAIISVLLSFKVKPSVRYSRKSDVAAVVAGEIMGTIGGERDLFLTSNRATSPALLLVLDRRDDPITPLLTQWTYQAMVHELIPGGIKFNRVELKDVVKDISEDLKEINLSSIADDFFAKTMYSNYGDFLDAVKKLLDDYQSAHSGSSNITSIDDMQRFVEKYPELKTKGMAAGKHVALMTALTQEIDKRRLMELSEVEQAIASSDDPNDQLSALDRVLSQPGIQPLDALRLVMIYSIRYEKTKPDNVRRARQILQERVDVRDAAALIDTVIAYGGAKMRSGELFASGSVFNRLSSSVLHKVKDVQNVFTQHQPLVVNLLSQISQGRLSKEEFPYIGQEPLGQTKWGAVIIFMVGGATYEEAAAVANINSGALPLTASGGPSSSGGPLSPSGVAAVNAAPFRVILGGTQMLNANLFLAELTRMQEGGSSVTVNIRGGPGDGRTSAGVGIIDLR